MAESENTDEEVIQEEPKPAAKSIWGSLMSISKYVGKKGIETGGIIAKNGYVIGRDVTKGAAKLGVSTALELDKKAEESGIKQKTNEALAKGYKIGTKAAVGTVSTGIKLVKRKTSEIMKEGENQEGEGSEEDVPENA